MNKVMRLFNVTLLALLAACFASSAWATGTPSASRSTAIASPTTVIANGIAISTISVTLTRANKKTAGSGHTVTLTAGSGSSIITAINGGATDGNGVATFTVKNAVAESVTYTAVASDTGGPVTIIQKPIVNFVRAAPTVAKSFSPATIAANGTSTLTITLTNPNLTSISGATFSDAYPANLVNAGVPALSNACGGTATASAGGTSLTLSGGTIASNCTVSVTVTSATAGSYVNNTGAVTSTNAATGTAATATLTVTAISAANSTVTASPTTVLANGVATSTITVTLRDGANLAVSGKTVTLTQSGVSSTILAASGLSDINGVVTFIVKDAVAGTVGTTTFTATSGGITVTQTAAVTYVLVPILKSFATSPIAANGTSTLTVTLTNSSGSSISGAGFTDTYPAGLVNAANPSASGCGAGVLSGTNGGNTLGMSGATIIANSACTVSVSVTASTTGSYSNTATNTSSSTSTASLIVTAISPTLSTVSASPTSVPADGVSTSTITVTLKDGAGNPVSGKTVSLASATGSSVITAVSNAGGVATFTVKDTIAEGPIIYTATDTTDSITVTQTASVTFTRIAAPAVAKSFSPATIADYGTSTLTITLTNPNSAAISGVEFTDTYPATGGLTNTSTLVLSNTCGGTNPGTAARGTTLTLSGGTIPASSSCSVSVQVTAAFPGVTLSSPIVNSTGAVTSSNATTGTAAVATLTVVNVSAANSTVVASPTSVPADNTTTSTITVTLKDGGGNPVELTNVSLAASGGSSTITVVSAITDVNGVATFTVKDSVVETVTYTATDTTDAIVITQQAVVTFASYVANFDVVEVGAAKASNLYAKLSGTSFSVDILALTSSGGLSTSYASTVTVKLVDASSGACAAMTVLQDYGSSTFTAGTGRKTLNLSYASATRNARIRINDATAGITACSTDNFTIRPQSFTVTANLGGSTLKAGNNFTMTAATAVAAGYTGTPVLNTALVQDHNAAAAGTLNGTFAAATVASATGTFQYHDVGTISLLANAVTDSAYTSVDQASDCVSGSTSNTLAGGKYGCNVGSVAAGPFGRFYPDHFTYATTLTPACVAGSFTYMDQAALGLSLTLSAKSANETTTARYTAGYSPLGTLSITGDNSGTALSLARLSPGLPAFAWSNGVYTVTGNRAFTRNATPDGPYDSFALKSVVTDPDGATITGTNLSNTTKVRHGRVRLLNAYGSELLALLVPFRIEYWQGAAAGWQINAADTCTPLAASNFAFAFPAGNATKANNLAACETALTVSGSAPNFGLSLSKPGSLNSGWADLTLNLGASALSGNNQCVMVGGAGAADIPANIPWLQHNWKGAGNANPIARATFGIYKSPLIYRRENY